MFCSGARDDQPGQSVIDRGYSKTLLMIKQGFGFKIFGAIAFERI
jgi:hypothetical protein